MLQDVVPTKVVERKFRGVGFRVCGCSKVKQEFSELRVYVESGIKSLDGDLLRDILSIMGQEAMVR